MAAFLVIGLALTVAGAGASQRVELGQGAVAVRSSQAELFLEVAPHRGEGLLAFSRRLCGEADAAAEIRRLNGASRLLAGVRYRVPFELLTPELQARLILALYPQDRATWRGWSHRLDRQALADGTDLWRLAHWFTGEGENFRVLREVNGLPDDHLSPGQSLLVPAALLRPALRGLLPPAPPAGGPLEYRQEAGESFAVYRLRPGEALYSSVVMRFTGRIYAEDVNALAEEIAAASGIRDVTDIPVGYQVQIPLELLLPEFLPVGHPRRLEYEASLLDSNRFMNEVQSRHLEGITVILDAGHGGTDVGASKGGVWESVYVYDIMLRVQRALGQRTAARVLGTVSDGQRTAIPDRDVLPYSRGHRVLTTPPYPIEDSRVGVNLRWYLANSLFRSILKKGGDAEKVVFVSIHADSLHPSLRGAMVYIPSTRLTAGRYGQSGVVYASRAEYKEQSHVEFSWKERSRSEGLSRDMAERMLASLQRRGLAVHEYKPVREKIIRKRSQFVPAVLRYNAVPAKLLLEVCNLANDEDRQLMQTRRFRQEVAEAVVDGLLAYYGQESPPAESPRPVAAR